MLKTIPDRVTDKMNLTKGSLSGREQKIDIEAYNLGRAKKDSKPNYNQPDIGNIVKYVKTRLRALDISGLKIVNASFAEEWLNILVTGLDRDPVKMDAVCLIEKELEEQGSSNVLLIPYIE